jgi:hypothetical protein
MDIRTLITDFANQLTALVERQSLERTRAAVLGAFSADGGSTPARRGRPPKAVVLTVAGKPRRKPPKQFCPVPGCKNPAAPVFGMVCAKHKDVAKSKIKKYREARRAKKAKSAT